MRTATAKKMDRPSKADPGVSLRIVHEGYGPSAWHGANLKVAISDVTPTLALWRPRPGRHNIAEVTLHHAWCVHSAIGQLTGNVVAPFGLTGENWFDVSDESTIGWSAITALLETEQKEFAETIAAIGAGRIKSPLADRERFDLALGITCHAVYHAGQIQLIKALSAE